MSKDDKSKSGFFHTLKKTVFSGSTEKTVDPAFDSARSDFQRLHDHLHRVRTGLAEYQRSLRSLFTSSKLVCEGFGDVLEDAPKPHPYQQMLLSVRRTRADLVSDRGEGALALTLQATTEKKINEELELHALLQARIVKREELRAELDYYSKKVDELRAEKEKKQSKGKEPSESEIEKFDRNARKQAELAQTFKTTNEDLTRDLLARWDGRVAVLGPALSDFVALEKQVLVVYAAAVRDSPIVEEDPSLLARAKDARKQAEQYASQAKDSASQALQNAAAPHLQGTNGMLASYAASSALSDLQRKQGSNGSSSSFSSSALDEFKLSADAQFRAAAAAPNGSSSSSAASASSSSSRPAPSAGAWDAPPMLSAIADSGLSVGAAMDYAGMNSDGSRADDGPSGGKSGAKKGRSPSPPPPVPHHAALGAGHAAPAFYGSGESAISAPGGARGHGPATPPPPPSAAAAAAAALAARPRMDSFGRMQQRGEGQGPAREGKSPSNPFDDDDD